MQEGAKHHEVAVFVRSETELARAEAAERASAPVPGLSPPAAAAPAVAKKPEDAETEPIEALNGETGWVIRRR